MDIVLRNRYWLFIVKKSYKLVMKRSKLEKLEDRRKGKEGGCWIETQGRSNCFAEKGQKRVAKLKRKCANSREKYIQFGGGWGNMMCKEVFVQLYRMM